jgi:uncharacterized protein (TIGR02246 family)
MAIHHETAIRGILEAWAAAVRVDDMKAILQRHDPNIRMFNVPEPTELRGTDAYRRALQLYLDNAPRPVPYRLHDIEVVAGNDVAFAHGLIACNGSKKYEQPSELTVRLTVCLERRGDEWVIVHEHHSTPIKLSSAGA